MPYRLSLSLVFVLLVLVSCTTNEEKISNEVKQVKTIDLTKYPDSPPSHTLNLLFIHHSCGGQLMADKGPSVGQNCIYKTHPNGGGLRRLLEQNNYNVHEASYHSIIGDKTDLLDWPPKFRDQMDRILKTKNQDDLLPDDEKNQVIMFKSCFPNNNFPDDASVKRAKDAYKSLLPIFEKYPDTLFVAVTAPPLVSPNGFKNLVKRLLGKSVPYSQSGKLARQFNNWLKDSENGWLSHYRLKNVVVFDYYDILTKHGKSNWAEYGSQHGQDSHPNSEGNGKAAEDFVPFLNRAVHRAFDG